MTKVFLIVSVACNVWFLLMLLSDRITERLTDEAMSERLAKAMAVFVDTVNTTVAQAKSKVFVVPDNIEEFDIRNYV